MLRILIDHRGRYPLVGLVMMALLLSACAGRYQTGAFSYIQANDEMTCLQLYQRLSVRTGSVRDAEYHPLKDYPFLRTSRFLSYWVEKRGLSLAVLREQNRLARASLEIEVSNIPAKEWADWLNRQGVEGSRWPLLLQSCGDRLVKAVWRDAKTRLRIVKLSVVPDHYQASKRVLGFYPLLAPFFKQAVVRDHRKASMRGAVLAEAFAAQPSAFTGYVWPEGNPKLAVKMPNLVGRLPGYPDWTDSELHSLFSKYAPQWVVETETDSDRIGSLTLTADGRPVVAIDTPSIYVALTQGVFRGRVTSQLNYVIWFQGRPSEGVFDLLAGTLDSLVWRVHLDAEGQPIAYDSIHGCGCWYQLWPAMGFAVAASHQQAGEPVLVGSTIRSRNPTLIVSSTTHQLAVLDTAPTLMNAVEPLVIQPYQSLKSLSYGVRRKSLFNPQGLVEVSRRPERWLFWPMGIASAGASRVMGTHAISFVGRRHFDDPELLETLGMISQ